MKRDELIYRAWLATLVEKYRPILFLEKYRISFQRKDEKRHYLSCGFSYPYLDTTIFYSGSALEDWKSDRLTHERRVVHEFCHMVTDPFYAIAADRYTMKQTLEDARERLTDHLAMVVLKLTV